MRKCHVCGLEVEDKVYICPDCGAEVVGSSGNLSLKAADPEKKKKKPTGASLGTSIGTGSGLTDILRAENAGHETDYVDEESGVLMGSIPTSYAKNNVGDNYVSKKKSNTGKIIGKIIGAAVLIVAVFFLAKSLFGGKVEYKTYQSAMDAYVEAINDQDIDKMKTLVAPYESTSLAQEVLSDYKDIKITKYEVKDNYTYSAEEMNSLQESIKLETSKTAKLATVSNVKFQLSGTRGSNQLSGSDMFMTVQFVEIRGNWYVTMGSYEDIDFN